MNKKMLLLLFLSLFTNNVIISKQDKLEILFDLLCGENFKFDQMKSVLAPLFAQGNFKDEQTKHVCMAKAFDEYVALIKKEFITIYGKEFNDAEVQEIIQFYTSPIGKKLATKRPVLDREMQNTYMSIMNIAQDMMVEFGALPEIKGTHQKSTAVIYFEDMVKKDRANAQEVFEREITAEFTIVKFSAQWCPPCKAYAPLFDQVAEQMRTITINGKKIAIKYIAIDIDQFRTIAQHYNIMSIPTTIFYRNGKQVESINGGISKDALIKKIKEIAKN